MSKRNKETTEISVYPVSPLPIHSASTSLSAIGSCALAGLPLQSIYTHLAGMAELVDAPDLKSVVCKDVRVRVPLSAPSI